MDDTPSLSADEKTALVVLLTKVLESQYEREAADALKAEADKRSKAANAANTVARNAFVAFGLDMTTKGVWDRVRAAMGEDAWHEAFTRAKPRKLALGLRSEDDDDDEESKEEDSTESADGDGDGEAPGSQEIEETETTGTRVRDLVLAELAALGGTGELASVLRTRVERKLGRSLHQKTIGMTLYRLSKENLTRRNGRMWFLVPPSAETRDPGVAAPGPEEGQNGKEDA